MVLDIDSSVGPTHCDQEGAAYNLANIIRTLALSGSVNHRSLTTLRESW